MSDPTITSSSTVTSSAAGSPANAATPSTGSVTNPTAAVEGGSVSNLAELKDQSPEVYSAMMQGIAMNVCSRMAQQQAHLKQVQEEARRASEG